MTSVCVSGRDERRVTVGASTRLVGRDAQLSVVSGLLGRAADGEPGILVVAGDAGVGKTRFVREVATSAVGDGWTVLTGGCVELSEGAAMLAPVAGVLRQLARDRGEASVVTLLEGPAQRLARLVPELGIDTGGLEGGSPVQVLVSFHRLVRDLADERPVLLVLEDLHWADATTRDLLRHLASRLYDERLFVVATVRTDDLDRRHPLRPVLAEIVRRPEVDRLDLGPLDPESLTTHLAALTGEGHGRDLAAIVARACGNPFFAEELLAVGVGGGLPPTLEEVLSMRLERLPADSQHLLGEAAVLGESVDPTLLAAVTSLDQPSVRPAVRAALDDGVLLVDGAGYAFRHALLREVALDRLLPDERVDAHAAAAAALEADPERAVVGRAGANGQAAHHWWEARDLPHCLAASVAAASDATHVFAGAVALRHLRRAIEIWGRVDDPEQLTGTTYPAVLLAAARVAWEIDDPAVRHLGPAAIRAADEAGDATARAEAAFLQTLVLARFSRGEEALEVAATELARHAEEPTVSRSLALSAHAAAVTRVGVGTHGAWDLDAVASDLDEALAIARECGDTATTRSVLSHTVEYLGPYLPNRAGRAASELAALGGARWAGETADELACRVLAHHAYFCGRFTELATVLDRWHTVAATTADTQALPWVMRWSMSLYADTWSGRLDRASRRFETVGIRDYEGSPQATTWMVWAAGDLLRWTGRVSRALDRAELVITAQDAGYHKITWAAELAASRAAAGWPPDDLVAAADATVEASLDRWWPWAIARMVGAVATAAAGRPLADDLLSAVDGWLARLDHHVRWLRADAPLRPWATVCIQQARADRAVLAGAPDPALWDPVVAYVDEHGGVPYAALARLRRADARAAADGGTSPACEADLLAAWGTFTDLAMTVPQDDVVALARRLRVRLPGRGDLDVDDDGQVLPSLTDREREVLALVAQGWSNKRVGAHLFISHKTVSVHLSNAMRKLDVDSRTKVVLVARRAGLVPDG